MDWARYFENENNKDKIINNKILKGGKTMETKSRYEVIAELEEKKRELILEGDNFDNMLKGKERELKEIKRKLEDKEEDIKDFKERIKQMKETNKELIKSVDESLKRFETLNKREDKK